MISGTSFVLLSIGDYTVKIDVPDGPAEGNVTNWRHRALVDMATGDFTKVIDDLDVAY